MELGGKYEIAAPRQAIWNALRDAEVLKECIPGCQAITQTDDGFIAEVALKVGPIRASFKGRVIIENETAPERCTIRGEGTGGMAGFAKGSADVLLVENGDVTTLTYTAQAQVGGKLAQIGSRLIQSTAYRLADQFFSAFASRTEFRSDADGVVLQRESTV